MRAAEVRQPALTVADAGTKLYNPDFWVKMVFIFAGVWLLVSMRKRVFDSPAVENGVVSPGQRGLA
jgi:hypothetical protein